jgi:hypothetical protein
MKILLRSMMVGSPTENADMVFKNFLAFNETNLSFDLPEDNTLYQFIKIFSQTHNHSPSLQTIRNHFEHIKEIEVVDRLEVIGTYSPIINGDFIKRAEEKVDEQRQRQVTDLLKEASVIMSTGLEIREGKDTRHMRGASDAIKYLLSKSHEIVTPIMGSRLSGEITNDGGDFITEYDRVKLNPTAGIGQYAGIQQIDDALGGAKKGELWTHAAFTGQLKSSLMMTWAYNQAVYYLYDSLIFSLEMPYSQCRRILYAMHSMHEKFTDVRISLGIQKDPNVTVGLQYGKIRDAHLNDNEEQFLRQHVVPDFNSGEYGKIHIEVADPDKSDFTLMDAQMRAEMIYNKTPFHLLFLDHAGLLAPRKWVSSTTERLNEIIRDAKRLAMKFNKGQGIPVVSLFQLSREGFKAAEKNGGLYNLTHLSYANEAERSSDIITTTYLSDEMRKKNRVQFQCLKSRDQQPFDVFQAHVDWNCRRILTSFEVQMIQSQTEEIKKKLDELG